MTPNGLRRLVLTALIGLWAATTSPQHAAAEESATRPRTAVERYALIIGANNGGNERVRLLYAVSDAEAFARVLHEMGGVPEHQAVLVREPTRADVYAALNELEALLPTPSDTGHARVEVVVYYSGYSDEQGLLLGGELLTYKELRAAIDTLSADVRIVVLDSCSSGALTQAKGGQRSEPFLIDDSTRVEGHAFLTSSSANETAQESERIGGSFFTHYLVTGLRGAADVSGDDKVTLGEAYQFAFHETLKRTERTLSGPQHPAFDIQLTGSGDLVLTDLRKTPSTLILENQLTGRVSIRDDAGRLVAELNKLPGRASNIGLEPGEYTIVIEDDSDGRQSASVILAHGERVPLSDAAFQKLALEVTTARGDAPEAGLRMVDGSANTGAPHTEETLTHEPFTFAVLPHIGTNVDDEFTLTNFSLNLLAGRRHTVDGFELGLGLNHLTGDLKGTQFAVGANLVDGHAEGVQFATGVNIAHDGLSGVQLTAGYNHAGDGEGLQFAGGVNTADSFSGIQLAGGYNHTDELAGIQLTGGVNYAEFGRGVQFALVNIGGHVQGGQVGLVNVAGRVDGVQIGLVNVAESSDVTLGPLNFVEDGYMRLAVWASELTLANLGLKLGGEYFYTFLTGGYSPEQLTDGQGNRYSAAVGIGIHIPTEPVFVDLEFAGGAVFNELYGVESPGFLGTFRVSAGWDIVGHFALIGGISFNILRNDLEKIHEPHFNLGELRVYDVDQSLQMWPGLFLGFQL